MKKRNSLSIAVACHFISTGAFEHPWLGNNILLTSKPSLINVQIQRPIQRPFRLSRSMSSTNTDTFSLLTGSEAVAIDRFHSPTGSEVAASGTILSCLQSSNLRDSIMVIKLREDDFIMSDEARIHRLEEGILSVPILLHPIKKKQKSQGDDFTGKTVLFSDGRQGVIVAQRPPLAFVLCNFLKQDTIGDNEVAILNTRTIIAVSDSLIGKTVDCFGKVVEIKMDGSVVDSLDSSIFMGTPFTQRDIFAPIPQVKDISLINSPFLTGTAMIDALSPIGRGQNMLLVGEQGLGQRDLLIGAIITQIQEMKNQISRGITCIYAITSLDNNERAFVMENLQRHGLLEHIILVTTRDHHQHVDSPQKGAAAYVESVTVAATACAIGEAFALSKSHNCVVFVDNLDHYKKFWDWTTNALVSIYGIEAVVKADLDGGASSEMRAFYSGLIQRSARFNKKNGDGSVTLILVTNIPSLVESNEDDAEQMVFDSKDFAHMNEKIKERVAILEKKQIPLTSSNLQKINIPLPIESDAERRRRVVLQYVDDLISMTDGQIWLDEKLFANGQRPPLDPQRSITRVGIGADTDCRADAPIIRKIVGGLRFEFAQVSSLVGIEMGEKVDKQILKRDAYLLAMTQNPGEVRRLSENCILLLAASIGGFDSFLRKEKSSRQITDQEYAERLVQYVETQFPTVMESIDINMDATPSELDELRKVILHFASKHG